MKASKVWKTLCEGLRIIRRYVKKMPGELCDIDFLRDPWLTPIPFSRIPTYLNMDYAILEYRLSDMVLGEEWNVDLLKALLPMYWVECVISAPPPKPSWDGLSKWCWEETLSGYPKPSEVYKLITLVLELSQGSLWRKMWRLPIYPKQSVGAVYLLNFSLLKKCGKLNVDGSVEESSRLVGAAYVGIQDTPRRVLGAGFTWWPWASPLRAELEAIRMGIQACRSWGGNQMIVCSDSQLLITLLQGTGMGPSILQDSIEHIRTMVDVSESVVFRKVSRDAVQALEALAKYARRERIMRHTRMMKDDAIRQIFENISQNEEKYISMIGRDARKSVSGDHGGLWVHEEEMALLLSRQPHQPCFSGDEPLLPIKGEEPPGTASSRTPPSSL
ncbi:hypothetical protein QJS10_CPA01g01706 [Acorus calamus]|uniref:RNase H type-1 domain-containing protein n=1 Tax=Acorus calamus TaxID=4465 RepID=A0AAV9FIT3_ACOCL|nr:hypothetical protein QJS10_CPA01g01706 [Acorus calamus]